MSDSIHEARMQFCGPHQARLLVAPAAMIPPRVTTAALTWTVMVHVTSPEPVCLDACPNKQYYKTVAAIHWFNIGVRDEIIAWCKESIT